MYSLVLLSTVKTTLLDFKRSLIRIFSPESYCITDYSNMFVGKEETIIQLVQGKMIF